MHSQVFVMLYQLQCWVQSCERFVANMGAHCESSTNKTNRKQNAS